MADEPKRTSFVLIPRALEALDSTAARTGMSKTDVVNRALQAYAFLEEQMATGAKILVQRGKTAEEVRFL